ncbi:Predicted membrane protein [Citrobacter freundii]|nr:Predicted membrane protein [Citrobacter freundii]
MDARFVQAHKEARWALWLTLLYLAHMVSGRLLTRFHTRLYRLTTLVRNGLSADAAGFHRAVLGDGEVYLSRHSVGG